MLSLLRRALGSKPFFAPSASLRMKVDDASEKYPCEMPMPDKLYKTIELEMKSSEKAVMKSYTTFVKATAEHLGINIGEMWNSRKPNFERLTLLKSIHIYRKHLVQYEIRTHYQWMQFHKLTGSTADTFLEYIERMLPEGVGLKVSRISIEPLPSHLNPTAVRKAREIPEKTQQDQQQPQL